MSEVSERRANLKLTSSQPVGTYFITYQEILVKVDEDEWKHADGTGWGNTSDRVVSDVMYSFAHTDPSPFEQGWFS